MTKQKIMQRILKNSPNTKYTDNPEYFKNEFKVNPARYSKPEKEKEKNTNKMLTNLK